MSRACARSVGNGINANEGDIGWVKYVRIVDGEKTRKITQVMVVYLQKIKRFGITTVITNLAVIM